MNRKQAGVFAVGVLAVAIAIVIASGFFGVAGPPPAGKQTAAAPAGASTGQARPEKAAGTGSGAPAAVKRTAEAPTAAEASAASGAAGAGGPAAAGTQGGRSTPPLAGPTPPGSQPAGGRKTASATPAPAGGTGAPAGNAGSGPIAPSFDLLRVEPDGSTVIAGRAAPGSKVEVIDRSDGKSLLTTSADGTGSFVAVFDAPLAPGNHELVLKSVGRDNSALYSREVATVRVPADGKGDDLLAMVSKPGEASRIITAPMPKVASLQPEAGASVGAASAPVAGVKPSAGDAAAPGAADPGMPQVEGRSPARVHVDAVEIENDRIYVAGAAPRGSTVRVYADDKYIGETRATREGRFVVNGAASLAPGRHSVRADLVDPASGKVAMRASVPFDRPAGGNFAAVSPQFAGGAPVAAGSGGNPPSTPAPSGTGGPATIVQPALTSSDNFVIIRRGDTLWQISRRTYGRGVRYTTIYLANSQQISDPNLILPGQVFDVPGKPEKTVDQAIELHRELLRKERRNR